MMLRILTLTLILSFLPAQSYSQNFWERIDSPTDKFLRTLHFTDSLHGWVGGDSGLIIYTSDGGINWIQQQTNTSSKIMRLFFLDDNRAWALAWADASTENSLFFGTEILTTTDGGENWLVEQFREENVFLRGIYFLDSLKGFAGGEPSKFLQTTDAGINWIPANIDSGTFAFFPVINFNFYNELYGYACGGRFDIAGVIWRTTNAGGNWLPIDTSSAPADQVYDIHFFDSTHVMGVGGDPDLFGVGVLHSTNAGNSWDYFEIGVFGQAYAVSFRNENEGWAVVPTSENFVATYDFGQTWTRYTTTDSSRLYDIVFTDSLTGYAVGEEGVILKYKYQKPDNIKDEYLVGNNFSLLQNYPNPFNPSTTISYNLDEPGFVKLKVYNILGKYIITLVDDYKQSGNYKIEWNAEDEVSGTYFIQLNVNGKLKTKKMMLLK
jgi:photosystem II stability/assembly factor-like uncharacterized protein